LILILNDMSFFKALKTLFSSAPKRSVSECHGLIRQGKAIIVDVREPNECKSGYADKAYLLPLSDLTGEKKLWTAALSRNRDKEIFLYCAAGSRSGMATKVLCSQGFKAYNTGGFKDWVASGWPVKK
jgi:rhodanese-related sulfurtransferase